MLLAACLGVPAISGCHVFDQAKRTTKYEHHQYPYFLDRRMSRGQYRTWASEAWRSTYCAAAGDSVSTDLRRGFFDGFADFCYAGGGGEPPLVPPRYFWSIRYRNQVGDRRIEDWRRGFRLGAQAADEGGYRRRAVVSVAMGGGELEGAAYSVEEKHSVEEKYSAEEDWDEAWDPSWDEPSPEVLPLPSNAPDTSEEDGVIINAPALQRNGLETRRGTPHEPHLIGRAKRDVRKRGGSPR